MIVKIFSWKSLGILYDKQEDISYFKILFIYLEQNKIPFTNFLRQGDFFFFFCWSSYLMSLLAVADLLMISKGLKMFSMLPYDMQPLGIKWCFLPFSFRENQTSSLQWR